MDSLHEHQILADELLFLVREQLANGHRVRYLPFRGVSMLPMLRQGIDSVELAPLPHRLRKYDLPVYQYPSGKVVMHRIVKVQKDNYVCLGDNTYQYEYITHGQLIGLVSAFRRGNRRIEVTDPIYQLYCRSWVALYPVRKLYKRIKGRLRRMFQ